MRQKEVKGSLGWEERGDFTWRNIFRALNRVSLWLQGNAAAVPEKIS